MGQAGREWGCLGRPDVGLAGPEDTRLQVAGIIIRGPMSLGRGPEKGQVLMILDKSLNFPEPPPTIHHARCTSQGRCKDQK